MCTRDSIKPLGLTASILSLIQGLIWLGFSIFALLIYTKSYIPQISYPHSYGSYLIYFTQIVYFTDQLVNGTGRDQIVTGDLMSKWVIAYIPLTILWIGSSLFLFYATFREKERKYKMTISLWAGSSTLVALCDLSISILMLLELIDVEDLLSDGDDGLEHLFYDAAMGLFWFLSRGVILWIVNVVFIVLLLKLIISTKEKPPDNNLYNNRAVSNITPKFDNGTYESGFSTIPSQSWSQNQNHQKKIEDNGAYNPIYAWLDPNVSEKVNIPRVPLRQGTFVKRLFNNIMINRRSTAEVFNSPSPVDNGGFNVRPHTAPPGELPKTQVPKSGGLGRNAPPPPPPPMPPPPPPVTPTLSISTSMFNYPDSENPLKSALKKRSMSQSNDPYY